MPINKDNLAWRRIQLESLTYSYIFPHIPIYSHAYSHIFFFSILAFVIGKKSPHRNWPHPTGASFTYDLSSQQQCAYAMWANQFSKPIKYCNKSSQIENANATDTEREIKSKSKTIKKQKNTQMKIKQKYNKSKSLSHFSP